MDWGNKSLYEDRYCKFIRYLDIFTCFDGNIRHTGFVVVHTLPRRNPKAGVNVMSAGNETG